MPYKYIEDEVTADIAFIAWGIDLPTLFKGAGDALMNAMVENPDTIRLLEERIIEISHEQLDLLLYNLLDHIIFYKDKETLLLRLVDIFIERSNAGWRLFAKGKGERLDASRHHPIIDVKAVTLHDLRVEPSDAGWQAHVVLDV